MKTLLNDRHAPEEAAAGVSLSVGCRRARALRPGSKDSRTFVAKDEADASNRAQQWLPRRTGQLSPEVTDMDVDHIALGVEMHVPHLLEERSATDDFLGVQQKILQELKLLGREIQHLVVHRRHVTKPIERYRTIAKHVKALGPSPAI